MICSRETQFRNAGQGRLAIAGLKGCCVPVTTRRTLPDSLPNVHWHAFSNGSQHPVDAGFEPTEAERRRSGSGDQRPA